MKSNEFVEKYSLYVIGAVALLILFNWFQIATIASPGPLTTNTISKAFSPSGSKMTKGSSGELALEVKRTGDNVQDAINALIPTGTPEWGPEIGVSYDDPVNSLNRLASLHRQVPTGSLSAEEKQRYIDINTRISCEFCCGAPSVVDNNGRDLCGCSHALSFMGLSKYIIKTHPEYTNEEILLELTKWKSLYYPRNMVEKGAALLSNDMELTASSLNDAQLLSKLSSGDTSSIGSLPSMVGGC